MMMITGVCLLMSAVVPLSGQQQATMPRVTLDVKQVAIAEVLKDIEKQTGLSFTYESNLLRGVPAVTLKMEDQPLEVCLRRLFEATQISYQISGKFVILKRKARQVTISGFIRDKASDESLIGASVFDPISRVGTASNNYGFFSLKLMPGDVSLQVSYIGYNSRLFKFDGLDRDTTLTVLLDGSAVLKEVEVVGSEERRPVLNTQMGALEVNQQTIKMTPVMFGESDIIKTLQLTPGVSAGTEGFAGMYVRGGNVDENLFLIDGNPVYQINHVGGIFSAFNAEAIRGMEFLKGGFPARYGGRLSSVVDVHTKEGNMKEYHGAASVGLISGNLSLEGPIVKDKTSFMVAFRRTWLDVLTAPALAIVNSINKKDGDKAKMRYAFHDLNVKLNHRFSDRSQLFVSLYNGNDVLKGGYEEFNSTYEQDQPKYSDDNMSYLRWGNLMATAGWTYVFNNQLFGKLSGVFTQYRSTIKQTRDYVYGNPGDADYETSNSETSSTTSIMDFGLRSAFDYLPSSSHHIRFGGDLLMHRFRPEYSRTKSFDLNEMDTTRLGAVYSNELLWAHELSAYAEDDWTLTPTLRANVGLRFSLFNIDNNTYTGFEPRASLRWLLRKNLSLKASYSRMNQYIHLVANSYMSLPTDAWMPVTNRLKPLNSDQFSLGLYYTLNDEYDFSVEGYYKKLNNLLEYRDGYSFMPTFTSWEEKMAMGKGRAYGAEFMVRKQVGKTTGWVGYALSWADRQFDELNGGKRFPSKYDNRHKLNIVVMHKLSPKVELTGAFSFASGNRMTLALENYESINLVHEDLYHVYYTTTRELDLYGERNNYQLPAYHRLDVGINIYRPKKKGRMGIWNVSIYNVYSRMNPFLVVRSDKKVIKPGVPRPGYGGGYSYNPSNYEYVPCFKTVGILPIIPSVTYTYKF